MTRRTLFLPAALLPLLVAGCATMVDGLAKVGEHDTRGNFRLERGWSQPADFKITPTEVAVKYGRLCKPKKICSYYADDKNYYLVADYGRPEGKSGRIAQIACPVVSGTNGSLLKIC
jgi:hypothetical protein